MNNIEALIEQGLELETEGHEAAAIAYFQRIYKQGTGTGGGSGFARPDVMNPGLVEAYARSLRYYADELLKN